jgi:methionyl-tRNA formyltransferase
MKKMSKTTKNSGKARVVFFGSGPVAAKSLKLLAKDFDIEAVVTKPTTVREMTAVSKDLCVYSVNNKKDLDDLVSARPFQSEVGILIDFGIIVSQKVIDYFSLGIINSHFSVLPEWRGADPISFAVLSGQKQTGVSLMLLTAGMDEGPLLAQSIHEIEPSTTTPELTDDLIQLSYKMLIEIVPLYLEGKTVPAPQEEVTMAESPEPTYSRKLTKEDGDIDWGKPAEQIEREIRAYLDWPKSRTKLAGKDVIITKAYVVPTSSPGEKPGNVTVVPEAKAIYVATSSGSLWIQRLKPAGKNEMTAEAFLAGHRNLL